MKPSRSRIANAQARNAKIKRGPPPISKYAAKRQAQIIGQAPTVADLAAHYNKDTDNG